MSAVGHRRSGALHLVMLLSGAAGLGYEIVWTRVLASFLGHEVIAVLAVLSAFFTGLALGAHVLHERIRRSAHPVHWYAALEIVIALWALVLVRAAPAAAGVIAMAMGPTPATWLHWSLAFGASFVLLLPATCAMGATLPAMERIVATTTGASRCLPGLYAANTAGAVFGTLLATFVLLPAVGNSRTLCALALLNLGCAAAIFLAGRRDTAFSPATGPAPSAASAPRHLLPVLFATGLLGVGFEVLVVRVLAQVLENTVYTFGVVLAVYLLGTALGAAWWQRRRPDADVRRTLDALLPAAAVTCLAAIILLWFSRELHGALLSMFGAGPLAGIAVEMALAAAVLLAPTLAMGALFSHLVQATRIDLGRALAANTLGAALAPVVVGILILPAAGAKSAALALASGYLLLVSRRAWRRPAMPALAASTLALWTFTPALHLVTVPQGGKLVHHVDGSMAAVSVVDDTAGTRQLKVDERFTMGGTATRYSDRRQAHIPLLLHPAPRDALFLGLGPGMTFAAAAAHPGLAATGVELLPEILPLLALFDPLFADLPAHAPRLRVVAADARRYVSATPERYDVIVADLFHPSRDGAGTLYTREHFAAVRGRLREGGLFCQWLPLYQLDLPTLRLIVRTFLKEFPRAELHLGHLSLGMPIIALVGYRDATPQALAGHLAPRLADPRLAAELREMRLDSDFALLGGLLAGAEELHDFAGPGPFNTDDLPRVTYQAPSFVYQTQAPAERRVLALLDELSTATATATAPGDAGEDGFTQRLGRYREARDAFLRAGAGIPPDPDPRRLLERTREPLLRIVRMSPDFDPAYRPLLGLAGALYESDPQLTLALLRELESANPGRTEARALRESLFGG
jgi:spermidine synthase